MIPTVYKGNLKFIQIGVISAGEYNCGDQAPGPIIFTRIESHRAWIWSILENQNDKSMA